MGCFSQFDGFGEPNMTFCKEYGRYLKLIMVTDQI